MTLEEILLQEICANPSDDTPRLVYADWLEENGHEDRANYIRTECGLLSELYIQKQPVWALAIARAFGFPIEQTKSDQESFRCFGYASGTVIGANRREVKWGWSRGFISSIECHCGDWLKYGREVVKVAPIERVILTDKATHSTQGTQLFGWYVSNTLNGYDDLPWCLWERLRGSKQNKSWRWFDSQEEMVASLSEACLVYAHTEQNIHFSHYRGLV